MVQDFYSLTLDSMAESKNERLWFKTNMKLANLWVGLREGAKAAKVSGWVGGWVGGAGLGWAGLEECGGRQLGRLMRARGVGLRCGAAALPSINQSCALPCVSQLLPGSVSQPMPTPPHCHCNCPQVLRELHRSCQTEEGVDDLKKGTQLLEIYALEIQMHTEAKNSKKLKQLYQVRWGVGLGVWDGAG